MKQLSRVPVRSRTAPAASAHDTGRVSGHALTLRPERDSAYKVPSALTGWQQQLGNQFVARLVAPSPSRAAGGHPVIQRDFSVQAANWKKATYLDASAAGQGNTGVFFLLRGKRRLVIKLADGVTRNQFGADLMKDVGVDAPETRLFAKSSAEGQKLAKVMKKLGKSKRTSSPAAQQKVDRVDSEGDAFMIMEPASGLSDFSKLFTPKAAGGFQGSAAEFAQLVQKLWAGNFFTDLGKIHAADLVMGNFDRVERLNLKNIFFNLQSGAAIGLDIDAQALDFDTVTGDKRKLKKGGGGFQSSTATNAPSIQGNEYKDWVNHSIEGSEAKRDFLDLQGAKKTGSAVRGETKMEQAGIMGAVDPTLAGQGFDKLKDEIIESFKAGAAAYQGMEGVGQTDDAEIKARGKVLETQDWNGAKGRFLAGIDQGTKAIMAKMQTGQYQQQVGAMEAQNGPDPNFSSIALQIKLKYLEQKQLDPQIDEQQLRGQLEQYAKFLHTGAGTDPFAAQPQPAQPGAPQPQPQPRTTPWQVAMPNTNKPKLSGVPNMPPLPAKPGQMPQLPQVPRQQQQWRRAKTPTYEDILKGL